MRIPDVAFISRAKLPDGKIPAVSVPEIAPDLAVEVLSRSNTADEMARNRREYFAAGVSSFWIVDPDERTVTVYESVDSSTTYSFRDTLPGGSVLPGFSLSLAKLFAELDREQAG